MKRFIHLYQVYKVKYILWRYELWQHCQKIKLTMKKQLKNIKNTLRRWKNECDASRTYPKNAQDEW